jgi:hypothetical protein
MWATRAREASRIVDMATTLAATAGSTGSTMRAVQAIVATGFICGTLDAISARIVSGAPWMRISQFIASGVLGPDSFKGGLRTALLGTALHYTIAFGATIVFFAVTRFMPMLLDHALLIGPLYGLCVHLFMQFVVLPMSAIGRKPHTLQGFLIQLAVHMIVVGPSIALTLRAVLRRP